MWSSLARLIELHIAFHFLHNLDIHFLCGSAGYFTCGRFSEFSALLIDIELERANCLAWLQYCACSRLTGREILTTILIVVLFAKVHAVIL